MPCVALLQDLAQKSTSPLPRKKNNGSPPPQKKILQHSHHPPSTTSWPNWQTFSIQDTHISSCVKEIAIFPGQPSCSMQKVKHCLKSCKLIIRSPASLTVKNQDPDLNRIYHQLQPNKKAKLSILFYTRNPWFVHPVDFHPHLLASLHLMGNVLTREKTLVKKPPKWPYVSLQQIPWRLSDPD